MINQWVWEHLTQVGGVGVLSTESQKEHRNSSETFKILPKLVILEGFTTGFNGDTTPKDDNDNQQLYYGMGQMHFSWQKDLAFQGNERNWSAGCSASGGSTWQGNQGIPRYPVLIRFLKCPQAQAHGLNVPEGTIKWTLIGIAHVLQIPEVSRHFWWSHEGIERCCKCLRFSSSLCCCDQNQICHQVGPDVGDLRWRFFTAEWSGLRPSFVATLLGHDWSRRMQRHTAETLGVKSWGLVKQPVDRRLFWGSTQGTAPWFWPSIL